MAGNIVIAGVGMVPFAKPGQSQPQDLMGAAAIQAALADAGIDYGHVQQAHAGYVFGDSCSGQGAFYRVGMSGIPTTNVNNNCGSGSTAFALAAQAVGCGAVDCALHWVSNRWNRERWMLCFPIRRTERISISMPCGRQ